MRSAAPVMAFAMLVAGAVHAQDPPAAETSTEGDAAGIADTAAVEDDGVRWLNAEGIPTYKIADDGTVDWPTFSGYRRYHAECHVCHGPDGEGSTYAPALKGSAMRMDYYDFVGIIASGRQVVNAADNQVMPAFGTNLNVMCYVDDIYTYLRARGTDAIPRGRPVKRAEKSDAYAEAEKACMEP